MMRNSISIILIVLITTVLAAWMLLSSDIRHEAHQDGHGHDRENHEAETASGPHGGRWLADDGFALEITLFETGLPPEMRVYAYENRQPVPPDRVTLDIELKRVDNSIDRIRFKPRTDYLRGGTVVHEPHSFEVSVKAVYAGKSHNWHYDNFEGRTDIPADIAAEMGIDTAKAGPVMLTQTRTLTGRVQSDPNRLSRVRPRFAGVVTAIHRELGDQVRAGDVLATVESNESLQEYDVSAPIDGLIVKRDIQIGEATGDESLFIIADLSSVWVELDVFVRDLDVIKRGQPVLVEDLDRNQRKTTAIDWISPLTAHASQSVRARAAVSNTDGSLRPGQFIRAHVIVAEHAVPLAVRVSALQDFRGFQVVFARFGKTYEVRMLETGKRNRDWVEVISGLEPGTLYVTENSYLIKADIEKSGASHDH